MILAAIDGQLLILLLMALFGFISWLSGKLNPPEKKTPPGQPRPSQPGGARRASADPEEERMRRFLEALGVPPGETPVPRNPIPPRRAPVAPAAPPPMPRAIPRAVPPPPPPLPAELSRDDLPTLHRPAEPTVLPDLIATRTHAFETVSSRISATSGIGPGIGETAPLPPHAPIHDVLRAALASPQQLRAAFVLREVLGPPPGLQA